MKIDIRFKANVAKPADLEDYANKRFSRVDHFTTRPLEGRLLIKIEGKEYKCECTLPISNFIVRAEVKEATLYKAIDECAEKIEKQIKSNKYKLVRSLQSKNGVNDLFKDVPDKVEPVNSAVKIKQYKLEVMTFDEAVTQLELLGHSFFVYKNDKDHVCVVYQRLDREYGLIETF